MIDVLGLLADRTLEAHTSIVLTYNLDLPLYDGLLRRAFRRAGVSSQVVFCDFNAYTMGLDAISNAPRMGRAYSVTPVRLPGGAFHPKVYMLLGRSKGRLVVGSGNASVGGLVRNAELFGVFDFDIAVGEPCDSAFTVCFELVRELTRTSPSHVQRQVDRALAWSPWLSRSAQLSDRRLVVSGPGRPSLLEQVLEGLAGREVQHIIAMSASFDRKLEALDRFAALASSRSVTCIVQPESAELDGESVRRVGAQATWKRFVDPAATEKKRRRDLHAHAKLAIFECDEDDLVVFGSANASRPAWLTAKNIEVSVLLPSVSRGSTVEALSLEHTMAGDDVREELFAKEWPHYDEADPCSVILLGAAVTGSIVSVLAENIPDTPVELVVARRVDDHECAVAPIVATQDGWVATLPRDLTDDLRLACVAIDGDRVSNWAALTWPDVARVSTTGWFGAKIESAIVAMGDGMVVGTVLFELLDRVRDFDVVYVRKGRATGEADDMDAEQDDTEAEPEAFYTDAKADELETGHWVGDRTDLDLLAALVQPLTGVQAHVDEDEVEDDDSEALAEEAERRAIDARKGQATGDEKYAAGVQPSRKSLERAAKRLARRLERAASSVEKALDQRRSLAALPTRALARQIWMTHIGAFLAGREIEASDGSAVSSLEPMAFAVYVLRICRALAGSRPGGLLALLDREAWTGHDGDALRRGLSFLWTCAVWATANVDQCSDSYVKGVATGPCGAAPWLVAARFVNAIRPHCLNGPDLEEIGRRLPDSDDLEEGELGGWFSRIDRLATFISDIEEKGSAAVAAKAPKRTKAHAGQLCFADGIGVTVIVDLGENEKVYLLNLSRAARPRAAFVRRRVFQLALPEGIGTLRWRAAENWD